MIDKNPFFIFGLLVRRSLLYTKILVNTGRVNSNGHEPAKEVHEVYFYAVKALREVTQGITQR